MILDMVIKKYEKLEWLDPSYKKINITDNIDYENFFSWAKQVFKISQNCTSENLMNFMLQEDWEPDKKSMIKKMKDNLINILSKTDTWKKILMLPAMERAFWDGIMAFLLIDYGSFDNLEKKSKLLDDKKKDLIKMFLKVFKNRNDKEELAESIKSILDANMISNRWSLLNEYIDNNPDEEFDIGKVMKVIAWVVNMYINQHIDNKDFVNIKTHYEENKEEVKNVYDWAEVYALSYIIVDDMMDNPNVDEKTKKLFYKHIENLLLTGKIESEPDKMPHENFQKFNDIFAVLLNAYPYDQYKDLYMSFWMLLKSQVADKMVPMEETSDFYGHFIIKAAMTRVIAMLLWLWKIDKDFISHQLVFGLSDQLSDDFRDFYDDIKVWNRTPFTEYTNNPSLPNPFMLWMQNQEYILQSYDNSPVVAELLKGEIEDTITSFVEEHGIEKLKEFFDKCPGIPKKLQDKFLDIASKKKPSLLWDAWFTEKVNTLFKNKKQFIWEYRSRITNKLLFYRRQWDNQKAQEYLVNEKKSSQYKINKVIRDISKDDKLKDMFDKKELKTINKLYEYYEYAEKNQPPNIIERQGWWAKEPIKKNWYDDIPNEDISEYYESIIIHHSGNADNNPTMLDIQKKQMKSWYADIAYNFGIDAGGNIYEWRPLNKKQAHTKVHNHEKWLMGILLLWDFDTKNIWLNSIKKIVEAIEWDSKIAENMLKSLFQLIIYLSKKYGINNLYGHSEYNEIIWMANGLKSCPGDKWEKLLYIAKIIMQDLNKE